MKITKALLTVLFFLPFVSTSFAQQEPNYTMLETSDGSIRLDHNSGEMSFCHPVNSNVVCTLAVEEREAWIDATEDMAAKISQLEKRIMQLEQAAQTAAEEREKKSAVSALDAPASSTTTSPQLAAPEQSNSLPNNSLTNDSLANNSASGNLEEPHEEASKQQAPSPEQQNSSLAPASLYKENEKDIFSKAMHKAMNSAKMIVYRFADFMK